MSKLGQDHIILRLDLDKKTFKNILICPQRTLKSRKKIDDLYPKKLHKYYTRI